MTPAATLSRLLLVALAVTGAGALRAQEVDELIRTRVEQLRDGGLLTVSGESITSKTIIPRLYEARAFTPTWRSAQQIDGLIEMIDQSWLEGLEPADYHSDAVRAARAAFEHVDTLAPGTRADLDVLLTDSVIRLGYHLRFGKADPVALDPDWNFSRQLVNQDPAKTIQAAIDARSMRDFAAAVIPRNFLYRRLRTALADYRGIADRGGWPTLGAGPTLKAGMTDARVPQLIRRLTVTGDYVTAGAPAGSDGAKPARGDAAKAAHEEAAATGAEAADSVIAAGIAVAAADAPLAPSGGSTEPTAGDAAAAANAAAAEAAAAAITIPSPAAAAFDAQANPNLYAGEIVAAVQRFQARHGLTADGSVGPATLAALNVPVEQRIAQLRANLERGRWVMGDLERDFIVVNIAGFRTYVVRDDEVVWTTRSVVGRPYRRTPIFKAKMTYAVLNPTWTVPPTIFRQDILPQLRRGDFSYLTSHNMQILDARGGIVDPTSVDWAGARSFPYNFVQGPGRDNALGRVKFMFPNEHFVYLHDTPSRDLFQQTTRAFSSGCIRLENPLDLATLLLGSKWDRKRIDAAIAAGKTETVFLDKAITVMLLYWTAEVDAQGRLAFWPDVYSRDASVIEALGAPFRAASAL